MQNQEEEANRTNCESIIISVSMVTEQVNAKINQILKVNVSIATNKDTNLQNVRQRIGIQNCESNIWLGLQHMV